MPHHECTDKPSRGRAEYINDINGSCSLICCAVNELLFRTACSRARWMIAAQSGMSARQKTGVGWGYPPKARARALIDLPRLSRAAVFLGAAIFREISDCCLNFGRGEFCGGGCGALPDNGVIQIVAGWNYRPMLMVRRWMRYGTTGCGSLPG